MPVSTDHTNLRKAACFTPLKDIPSTQAIATIDSLLENQKLSKFPPAFETVFQTEVSVARIRHYTTIGLCGVVVYNSFLFTDYLMMPDIFIEAVIVQLGFVTPITLITLYLICRRVLKPELSTTLCLMLIFASIIAFYSQSRSEYATFLIFAVPVCLTFGNVVLPLPYVMSVWFTFFCITISSIAVLERPDMDATLASFAILTNASAGLYMLFGTHRAEQSDRRAYLFNLRERLRGDLLAENNERLKNLSETDALTQIFNRRYFDASLDRLWKADTTAPLALCLIDIDHFKKLNDTYGHQAGDQCLREVAQCLKKHLLPNAILARYGGEEFVVLLPNVNDHYAQACAEVLRAAVERLEVVIVADKPPISVTISIGTSTTIPRLDVPATALTQAADRALYRAKELGRNRVEWAALLTDERSDDLRQSA